MIIHYLFLRTYVFISAACITISSVTSSVCLVHLSWAAIFPDPLPSIISSPPPSQSHHPWPTVVTITLFTAPRRCCHRGHITPGPDDVKLTLFTAPCHCCHSGGHNQLGPMPLLSGCSRPPTVVAVAVTSPRVHRRGAHVGSCRNTRII
jgi:hypothetical protein